MSRSFFIYQVDHIVDVVVERLPRVQLKDACSIPDRDIPINLIMVVIDQPSLALMGGKALRMTGWCQDQWTCSTGNKGGEGFDDEPDSTISLCSATFYLFAAASSLLIGNITGFLTIAQDVFVAKGLSITESLTGFLVFNMCSTFSRLAPGLRAKLNLSCFSTSLLASLLGLTGQLLISFTDSFIFLMIGMGLSGAAFGRYASSVVTATFELLGSSRQAVGFGIIVTINGISVSGVGPLFGAMRDASGHYKSVLITTSSLNAVCFIFICTVFVTTHFRRERVKRRRSR